MYNKNLWGRAGLTPEFEDGVKTFIEWVKVQSRHMDGDKIRCPCRKYKTQSLEHPMKSVTIRVREGLWLNIIIGFRMARILCRINMRFLVSLKCRRSQPQLVMLRDDVDLEYYKFCTDARYKPAEGETHTGTSSHMLSLEEPRNVRLGLCTNDFAPHVQYGHTYSCWPVIIIPYNLSPGMCMSSKYIFLTMAALMWTVNDLPVDGMASRWSTAGVMGCSVCMDDARAFHLQYYRKACYFDCHRQFLPTHHLYRRNKKAFTKNCIENKVARPRLTGDQLLDRVACSVVEMLLSLPDGYGSDHKWTKKSIFWDLPYWSTHLI
ncbi:UNVERIFIED_CONTAM: hypothetical protein Scaly_1496100 [Sesamum calycinum]|uniref:Transposase-associated domain-containing protein n=1 Tax=Sesamum calycinum TaxID=2727403 RepID=A0AAW2PT50_9LAMI